MILFGIDATEATLGLLATFGGIGVVVNGLVVFILARAWGERKENEQHRADSL